MKQETNNKEKEFLSATVERITFHNSENGFSVLRSKVRGYKELVTVVGKVLSITPGEYIKCVGNWYNDSNHGLQFKADSIETVMPDTLEGMEKYLGSGLIKGIGVHFAKRLIEKFGLEVFEVIEHNPKLLSTIEGIGKGRAASICNNWQDQKVIREIMVFLQSHSVGSTRAARIYKTYGEKAIEIVTKNPYILAKDIQGIGFISADKIAESLGIEKNSLIRAEAGVNYMLLEATSDGHCGLPTDILIKNTTKLLEIDKEIVIEAIDKEINHGLLSRDYLGNIECVFLTSYYVYEQNIARLLLELMKGKIAWESINIESAINWVEKKLNVQLADTQKTAVEKALTNKVMVITGGPGTGKTTLINSIVSIVKAKELKIKLAAPTGRAAKRLSESTKLEAVTIHRLLEFDPAKGKFNYGMDYKLKCDYLIIDEMSMVDVPLFYSLLRALPASTTLLLVGDVDQLPSVGAGQVLKDIIDSEVIPTIKLTEIFRQASTSKIITNAHLVNKGQMPDLTLSDSISDFYFISAEQGIDITEKVIGLVRDRIPSKFSLNPINDIQVLSPMQRGGAGVRALNIELQKALNPNYTSGIEKYGQIFAVNDKVMQTANDYDKEVYNGDIGVIKAIDKEAQEVVVNFYNRDVKYDYTDLDEVTLAYATTIHKSQGSEYLAVIIPLTMQSFMMLQRNLIYTAITRGKKLVIIVGEKKALAIAVKNNKDSLRYSKLKEWLLYNNTQNLISI
ncbi:MAG TPA: ATP-dependent RecD-like DNA helicase [Rickettsia endosymbiont of Omalisus fontisbellaquei]|nr:ATP-dependent RecD-like DNA helicase [Rickettsia endosymbiont of Omalisus fontisbellaquei]